MTFRGIGDGEGVVGRGEEEIVAERRCGTREQRRPQAEAHCDADDGGEVDEVGVLGSDPRPEQRAHARGHGHGEQGESIGPGIEGRRPFSGADGFLRDCLFVELLAGNDVHADISAPAQQIADDRAMQKLEPGRPCGFAEDDLRDVVCLRKVDHVVGNATVAAWNGNRFTAQGLRQTQGVGNPIPFLLGELEAALGLDIERRPGGVQAVR